jgi:hypothetical protein
MDENVFVFIIRQLHAYLIGAPLECVRFTEDDG